MGEEWKAQIDTTSGVRVNVVSDLGTFRNNGRQTILNGNVRAETSTGFHIQSQELVTDLDGILLSSESPVQALAPFGTLDAGNMMLNQSDVTNDGHVLVFNGGVKLIYTPQINKE